MGNKKRSRSTKNPQGSGQESRPEGDAPPDVAMLPPASADRSFTEESISSTPHRPAFSSVSLPSPTFLVLHSLDPNRQLSRQSPFLIAKSLQSMAGSPKSVRKLRSGDLLVETSCPQHSNLLLKTTTLSDIPITVEPHTFLNSSRGVISERDLEDCLEDELVTELSGQGVIAARRLKYRRDGVLQPSRTVVLTFNRPSLPHDIKAGYLHCEVRPFIPNPVRCFKCQVYGHSQQSCRGTATCAQCGKAAHDGSSCSSDPFCVNCKGAHPAFSRSCPRWSEEKAIQRVKTLEHLSYPEARRRVVPVSSSGTPSYAAVVRSSATAATQTPTFTSDSVSSLPASVTVETQTIESVFSTTTSVAPLPSVLAVPVAAVSTTASAESRTSVLLAPAAADVSVEPASSAPERAPPRRTRARSVSAEGPPPQKSSPVRSRSPIPPPSPDDPVPPVASRPASPASTCSTYSSVSVIDWDAVDFPTTFTEFCAHPYFSQFLPTDPAVLQRATDYMSQPRCPGCPCDLTVFHALMECPLFSLPRYNIFGADHYSARLAGLRIYFDDLSTVTSVSELIGRFGLGPP